MVTFSLRDLQPKWLEACFLCLRGENHGSGKKKFLWRAVAVFGIIMMDCQEGAIVRMIRAVAFDMDDTLLNNERQITPFTVSILRRVAIRESALFRPVAGPRPAWMAL